MGTLFRAACALLTLCCASVVFAQVGPPVTVNYNEATTAIANPERGYYHHAETHPSGHVALDQAVLVNWRNNEGITLVLRVFYLDGFLNAPISAAYLAAMQTDLNTARAAGSKLILRFAYAATFVQPPGPYGDATKARVLGHIAQLKPMFQTNADVIALVQAGFVGTWGEWYYTDHFGFPPGPADWNNRKEVDDSLLAALPADRCVQVRTPEYKRIMYGTGVLQTNEAFTGTARARVGHHNDCFLASATDFGTYGDTAVDYPYLAQETRFVPMGGETCAPNPPRSDCPVAQSEMQRFHWSYLNVDYHPTVISGFSTQGCQPTIIDRLGYRFVMQEGTYPSSAYVGGPLPVSLTLVNEGYAAPFNPRPVRLIMRNTLTNAEHVLSTSFDPRTWEAGNTVELDHQFVVPLNVQPGTYRLLLHLPDAAPSISARSEYAVRMANTGTWSATTGYNDLLHEVVIDAPVLLSAKMLLEGPFDSGAQLMGDGMRVQGLVPATEPYSVLGMAAHGGADNAVLPAVLATTGTNAVVDWVLVELRHPTLPAQIIATQTALVQRDGDIVATSGSGPLPLFATPGTYRVAVRHRNHLGAMTSTGVALTTTATALDFTNGSVTTFGTDAQKVVGSKRLLWMGNAVRDNQLKYTGTNNDRDPILTRVGGTVPTATTNGYWPEDHTLDGVVKYTGVGNDRDPILINVGGTVPTAVRTEQLP